MDPPSLEWPFIDLPPNHGPVRETWLSTGKLRTTGQWYAGKKVGFWQYFSETGGIEKSETYSEKGELDGPSIIYDSGKPAIMGAFREGRRYGSWIWQGSIRGQYDMNGNACGLWTYYANNGKVLAIGDVKSGVPAGEWQYFHSPSGELAVSGNWTTGCWKYYAAGTGKLWKEVSERGVCVVYDAFGKVLMERDELGNWKFMPY